VISTSLPVSGGVFTGSTDPSAYGGGGFGVMSGAFSTATDISQFGTGGIFTGATDVSAFGGGGTFGVPPTATQAFSFPGVQPQSDAIKKVSPKKVSKSFSKNEKREKIKEKGEKIKKKGTEKSKRHRIYSESTEEEEDIEDEIPEPIQFGPQPGQPLSMPVLKRLPFATSQLSQQTQPPHLFQQTQSAFCLTTNSTSTCNSPITSINANAFPTFSIALNVTRNPIVNNKVTFINCVDL